MNGETWYSALFRGLIGAAAIVGSLAALGGLYFIAVPVGNKDPLLLAIGIILGWGSSVVSSEYGASSTGRKVVDQAVKGIERQQIAAEQSSQQPAEVKIVNPPDDPANVTETKP